MKINRENYLILKAYIQAQLLLETLDEVENESRMNIKQSTKKYKNVLEPKIEQVIKNTFESNKEMFDKIILNLGKDIDNLSKHFEII